MRVCRLPAVRAVPDAALTFAASLRLTLAGFIRLAQKSLLAQGC
ncbi:hypothetical protein [Izhakiella australiensis]|nr:hypothetical protein [Izhakiella australiensis]